MTKPPRIYYAKALIAFLLSVCVVAAMEIALGIFRPISFAIITAAFACLIGGAAVIGSRYPNQARRNAPALTLVVLLSLLYAALQCLRSLA